MEYVVGVGSFFHGYRKDIKDIYREVPSRREVLGRGSFTLMDSNVDLWI